jgi:murein DD-endopeptidase MepM/ murein hydrolase activator NlpD
LRILIGLGGLILAILLLWIGALTLLPDARVAATRTIAVDPSPVQTGVATGGDVLEVPIAGVARSALVDSWGDPRDNGLRPHHGTDIMAPQMTPVRAAAPGTVEKLFVSAAGGTTLYLRTQQRDWTLYYAHLAGYAPGVHEGQAVRSGDVLGYVGDTGNAGAGNYHLHFGMMRTTSEQHWYQGEDVDPYPYLAGKQPLR